MAVEVKYVVIREGEEKMSFTSKKEAEQREAFRYGWQNKKMC